MDIAKRLKQIREAKGLTAKEVISAVDMGAAMYSRIENGKTEPSLSTLEKIAKALGIALSDLFSANDIFSPINSADKTILEKLKLIEELEEDERASLFNIIDGLFAKKKLKDTLTNALTVAS